MCGFTCFKFAEPWGFSVSPPDELIDSRDVYGIGLVLHCLSLGRRVPAMRLVETGRPFSSDFLGASPYLEPRIIACLAPSPGDRPAAEELLNVVDHGCESWTVERRFAAQASPIWVFRGS